MRWSHEKLTCHFRAVLLGTALVIPSVFSAQAMGLKEAIQQAISTNPDIGIVASNRQAVDEELRQARGLYLPQIDLALGIGRERTNNSTTRAAANPSDSLILTRSEASVTLQQRIFDGFEAGSTVRREKARVRSAANRVAENSEFLALDAIGAYIEVLRQRELVRLAEENLRVHGGILDLLQQRLAGGGGSSADVAQTNARTSRARATLTQTLNELRDAEAAFTRVVGQFPDALESPEFPSGVLPADLDSAVGLAGTSNPTTKIFEADVRSADAEVSISEVPFYPAITLEAESEYNDRSRRFLLSDRRARASCRAARSMPPRNKFHRKRNINWLLNSYVAMPSRPSLYSVSASSVIAG